MRSLLFSLLLVSTSFSQDFSVWENATKKASKELKLAADIEVSVPDGMRLTAKARAKLAAIRAAAKAAHDAARIVVDTPYELIPKIPPVDNPGTAMLPPLFDHVNVAKGQTVTWRSRKTANNALVPVVVEDFVVAGTLVIANQTHVKARTIHVLPTGKLIIGTAEAPVSNVLIEFHGQVDLTTDPLQWRVGLLVQGSISTRGKQVPGTWFGTPDRTQMRAAGDNEVPRNNVAGASGEFQLNRAIKIIGGHTAFLPGSKTDLERVEFVGGGRSTTDSPDDSLVKRDGTVLHLGQNQRGRYSCHWHHAGTGPHRAFDCVVRDTQGKWGFVTHATSNVLLDKCLTWKAKGAGFYREESPGNNIVWRNCLALASLNHRGNRGSSGGGHADPRMPNGRRVVLGGTLGDGYWTDHAFGLHVIGCTAIGCQGAGFNWNGYYRKDRRHDGKATLTKATAIGCAYGYWDTWSQAVMPIEQYRRRMIKDMKLINCRIGVTTYHTANLTFDKLQVLGDAAVSSQSEWTRGDHVRASIGIHHSNSSYENGGMRYTNTTLVTGCNIGVLLPINIRGADGTPNGAVFEDLRSGNHIDVMAHATRGKETGRHILKLTQVAGAPAGPFRWRKATLKLSTHREVGKHDGETEVLLNGVKKQLEIDRETPK